MLGKKFKLCVTSSNHQFLKLSRQLCNTHALHIGFNTKMLRDWQSPKQCGLSRDRNDQHGSWFAGTSEKTPDSKMKDGEHFNHRAEIQLSDKIFFLEHQWRHGKKTPTKLQSNTCPSHKNGQWFPWLSHRVHSPDYQLDYHQSSRKRRERSCSNNYYSLSTYWEIIAQSNKCHYLISWTN